MFALEGCKRVEFGENFNFQGNPPNSSVKRERDVVIRKKVRGSKSNRFDQIFVSKSFWSNFFPVLCRATALLSGFFQAIPTRIAKKKSENLMGCRKMAKLANVFVQFSNFNEPIGII